MRTQIDDGMPRAAPTSSPNASHGARALLTRILPAVALRRLGQIRLLGRVVLRLPVLVRRRGFVGICRMAWRFHADRSGWWRFVQWCLEAVAYERRNDVADYRKWIQQIEVPRHAAVSFAPRSSNDAAVIAMPMQSSDFERRLREATAPYVLLTHQNALLSRDAIEWLLAAAVATGADLVYCDEDAIEQDERLSPCFKPDFSIDLARSQDYVGPVFLVRTRVAMDVLGSDDETNAFAYALPLRLYEAGGCVAHVAEVLVHWTQRRDRSLSPSQLKCRDAHLVRCYGTDLASSLMGDARALQRLAPVDRPLVSIIIPTRDRADLLKLCIDSIYRNAPQVAFEILILDNRSQDAETRAWFDEAQHRHPNLRVLLADYEFNWSKLNNQGVAASLGRVLVFLNNDIEVISPDWLERLSAHALRPDAGAVGALLIYPEGTAQHAGVVLGLGGLADHVYSGTPLRAADEHIFVHPCIKRNVSICTGACLAVERAKLARISGFDETLKICGDIDVCVRLLSAGFLNVYDADVRLTHYESATRSRAPLARDEVDATMRVCAPFVERGDDFYNRNLSLRTRYPTLGR